MKGVCFIAEKRFRCGPVTKILEVISSNKAVCRPAVATPGKKIMYTPWMSPYFEVLCFGLLICLQTHVLIIQLTHHSLNIA